MQFLLFPRASRRAAEVSPRGDRFSVFRGRPADKRRVGLAVALGLISQAAAAVMPDVKASWNANPESDIAGYELSYGTSSGRYSAKLDAGLKTSTRISGLEYGVRYFFVLTAYSRSGQRSEPSAELSYFKAAPVKANQAPTGTINSPSTDATIVAGDSVSFSGTGTDPDGDALSHHWAFGSGLADAATASPGAVVFPAPGVYQVSYTVTDSKGLADPTPAVRTITVLAPWSVMPRTGWKLKYVNSEEANGYAAAMAFDGDSSTFWHTRWTGSKLPPPHELQIDLGATIRVKGFDYLPRQDGVTVGDIGGFEFYVSMDGKSWGKPVAAGRFTASATEKRVFSTAKHGRFIRLVSHGDAAGNPDSNIAELNVLQGVSANRAPSAASRAATTRRNKRAVIALQGSDADGDLVSYQILTRPRHGKLSGTAPQLVYIPDAKFTGKDSFTYRTHDGLAGSKTATVTIRVKKPAASATKRGLVSRSASGTPVIGAEIIGGGKFLTLTVAPGDRKRDVQVSSNLVDWFSGRRHTTVIEDNERFLKVRDNTPLVPGSKRYIRLEPAPR